MESLRGHTTGYAVPTYVVDAPGGGGKMPVLPNYLVSQAQDRAGVPQLRGLYLNLYRTERLPAA